MQFLFEKEEMKKLITVCNKALNFFYTQLLIMQGINSKQMQHLIPIGYEESIEILEYTKLKNNKIQMKIIYILEDKLRMKNKEQMH